MARQDGLELTDEYLGIIRYLRDCYADHGGTVNARMLTQSLEEGFAEMGGHRFRSIHAVPEGANRPGQSLCRAFHAAGHTRPVVRYHALKYMPLNHSQASVTLLYFPL